MWMHIDKKKRKVGVKIVLLFAKYIKVIRSKVDNFNPTDSTVSAKVKTCNN
jgi:hypothetical protein